MYIWKNTKTLDKYLDLDKVVEDKEKASVVLLGSKHFNIKEFPNLKGIFRVGVGNENVPIEEAKALSVKVACLSERTKNVIYEETANFTCSQIFKVAYENVGSIDPWIKHERKGLSEMTLALIGQGNIGSRVKSKMSSFMNVIVYDSLFSNKADLRHILNEADFVSLHIPGTISNNSFIDEEKLSWMKNNSCLINTARGNIVEEKALLEELSSGRLRASFDVFWKEPYNGELSNLPSFDMSPHIAGYTKSFLEFSFDDFVSFLKEVESA